MKSVTRNSKLALRQIGDGKQALSRIAFCALGGLLLTPFLAQAATVNVNFGQSAQNLTLAGLGPNGGGLGTYVVTMGACTPSGGNTTCIISGNYTSASPGFTSGGTYSLATTYTGTGTSPLLGVEQAAGSDFFAFSSIPATTTMSLTLSTSGGPVVVPLFANGQFVTGSTFGFAYSVLNETCSGTHVSTCSVGQVGVTAGSAITGMPTGSATFVIGNTYYFSDLAYSGGYQTTLTYVNYSPQTVTCTTNFYSDGGAPLTLPFASGTVSTRTDVMAPGASVHDQTIAPSAPPFVQGWAQATCNGTVEAGLLYRYSVSGVAVGEASVNAETSATTAFATFAQTATGIAYANVSTTQSATVTVEVYNTAGAVLGSHIITLGPLGHGAANVGPLLGLTNFTGFVKITSNIPIVSLSLNAEAFPVFSSLPPGDLPAGPA